MTGGRADRSNSALCQLDGDGMTNNGRDAATEAILAACGVDWEYLPHLSLAVIDQDKSLHNQARVGKPIDDEQAALYAEAYRGGRHLPPIIACAEPGRPRHILAAGNHRVRGAVLAGRSDLPAYLVKSPTPAQFTRLAYETNTTHGLPVKLEDRLAQAAYLVANFAMSNKTAASQLGVPAETLGKYIARRATVDRLRRLGASTDLGESRIERLSSIRSDVVFKAAAYVAQHVTADEFSRMVTDARKATSEHDALEVFTAAAGRIDREHRATANTIAPGAITPLGTLSRFANMLSRPPTRALVESIPAEDQPAIRKRLSDAARTLDEVASWLAE